MQSPCREAGEPAAGRPDHGCRPGAVHVHKEVGRQMSLKSRVALLAVLVAAGALTIAAGGSASTDVQRCTITGTNGNNVLRGTARADVICGRGGNDTIIAANGRRDRINCGPGRDTVYADARDFVTRCERVFVLRRRR